MKLLLFTRFHPSVGGLETVMEILAAEWAACGCEVQVATDVPAVPSTVTNRFPFPVHHQPSTKHLMGLVRWCEVYVQGCVGLKSLWPLLLCRRRYAVTHQTWYHRADGQRGWENRIKLAISRHAINIAPSHAIANDLETPCTVVPNPYRTHLFKLRPEVVRDRCLLFVGRLVSDKGVDLLLTALVILKNQGMQPDLTIVGDGPELPELRRYAAEHGILEQLTFAGAQAQEEVALLMNRHRVLVVPSRWSEPFGVVAVEGIACGCLVLGSEQGGLADAIGPCGQTFPNGDATALAALILELLNTPARNIVEGERRNNHLACHQPATVAQQYLQTFYSTANP